MDSRLFMEIGFVNDKFQAIDETPYERWINDGDFDNDHQHMILQRLVSVIDGEDNVVIDTVSINVADSIEELRNPFEKGNMLNGLYYYQKMLIPAADHVSTSNEQLYFDDNLKVHYIDTDAGSDIELDPSSDFDEIYELLRQNYPDNCFYFDDYAFSMYSLVECYVLTERERINNYLKNNCQGKCNNFSDADTKADILLAAITVIRNLLEKEEFFEAQKILNRLNTCGNLCNKYSKTLKGCGCGRA